MQRFVLTLLGLLLFWGLFHTVGRLTFPPARIEPPPWPLLGNWLTIWVDFPAQLPPLLPPIAGHPVPLDPQLLPGAQRFYRGGVHQGVDFQCAPGTPVRAALSGFVLDIQDRDALPQRLRGDLLNHCRSLRRTPAEILDVLHGRSVFLCHGVVDGALIVTRYSHLGEIRSDLVPGYVIDQGETLGWSGASGTSHVYASDGWAQLHFEVLLNGLPATSGLSPAEAGLLYSAAFAEELH